jgi:hypothetical protein
MSISRAVSWCLAAAMMGMMMASPAVARDAAFMDPGSNGGGGGNELEDVHAEPKTELDIGDTTIHSAKRQTIFFANKSGMPVKVEKLTVNGDANVQADVINDDCAAKQMQR